MSDEAIDPATLEVFWSRLNGIPDEMGLHLRRTAFSSVLRNAKDFSVGLFTWDGRLISQGVYTPGHLGSMPFTMQRILEEHFPPDEWEPGDTVITNNPYINSGHLPDIFFFTPTFVDGELIGFCVIVAHHLDVGGVAPGSQSMRASDVYSEGLQLPPLKLYEGGEVDETVVSIIQENSRVPDYIGGDLQAQRAASKVGTDLYRSLIEDYGFENVKRFASTIIDRTEVRMRSAIADAPDGTYSFADKLDGVDEPLPVEVEVTVDGDEIVVDFSGTAPQQPTLALNAIWNYTFAYTMLAVKSFFDPDTPQNQGTIEPITLHAPEGSIVNAKPPAPVGSRATITDQIRSTITGALHHIDPGRVPAAGGQSYRHLMKFVDPETGDYSVLFDGFYGGAGARADRDGFPAVSGSTNIRNTPIEAIEAEYPLTVHRYELNPDTGGAGEYRGGNGTVREYEFHYPAVLQLAGERFEFGPYGLMGGDAGRPGAATYVPDGEEPREVSAKAELHVEPGDRLRISLCGGGGYGDRSDRDAEAVRDDLRDDLLTPGHAESAYGFQVND